MSISTQKYLQLVIFIMILSIILHYGKSIRSKHTIYLGGNICTIQEKLGSFGGLETWNNVISPEYRFVFGDRIKNCTIGLINSWHAHPGIINIMVLHGDLRERYTQIFHQQMRDHVDHIISLSPSNRCHSCIISGYHEVINEPIRGIIQDYFVYVGRNSPEKNVGYIHSLSKYYKILKIGIDKIIYNETKIKELICHSKGLISPGSFEGGPLVAIYASQCGIPVFMMETGIHTLINATIISGVLEDDLHLYKSPNLISVYKPEGEPIHKIIKSLMTYRTIDWMTGSILDQGLIRVWSDGWIGLKTGLIMNTRLRILHDCKIVNIQLYMGPYKLKIKSLHQYELNIKITTYIMIHTSNCVIHSIVLD